MYCWVFGHIVMVDVTFPEAVKSESALNVSEKPGSPDYKDKGQTYVKGLSRSMNDMNRDNSGYHPLCLHSNASLPETSTSGNEASSFGSTDSSGKLLIDTTDSTDWDRCVIVLLKGGGGGLKGNCLQMVTCVGTFSVLWKWKLVFTSLWCRLYTPCLFETIMVKLGPVLKSD